MKRYAYFIIAFLCLFSVSGHAQLANGQIVIEEDSLDSLTVPLGATDGFFDSVSVYAHGKELTAFTDYIVNYKQGTVRLINPAVASSAKVLRVTVYFKQPQVVISGNKTIALSPLPINPMKHPSLSDYEQIYKSH